jgi:hypothetical protein
MKRAEAKNQDQKDRRLYRKSGRRYVPIGMCYQNYLSDGIWYVRGQGHSMTLLAGFDELPKMPELAVAARAHGNEAIDACAKHFRDKSWNLYEIGLFISDYLAGKIEREKSSNAQNT